MNKPSTHYQSTLIEKRKKKRMSALIFSFVDIVILFFISIFTINAEYFRINNIVVAGNQSISSEKFINIAERAISGKYFGIWNKNSAILYPSGDIYRNIMNDFPKVAFTKISLKNKNTVTVVIQERVPSSLWCDDFDKCFYMDGEGYLYSESADLSGSSFIKYYGAPGISIVSPIKSVYSPGMDFTTLNFFVQQVERRNLDVIKVRHTDAGDIELVLDTKAKIIMRDDQDTTKILEILDAILKENQTDLSNKIPSLDYLDVRYGNKIYYHIH